MIFYYLKVYVFVIKQIFIYQKFWFNIYATIS